MTDKSTADVSGRVFPVSQTFAANSQFPYPCMHSRQNQGTIVQGKAFRNQIESAARSNPALRDTCCPLLFAAAWQSASWKPVARQRRVEMRIGLPSAPSCKILATNCIATGPSLDIQQSSLAWRMPGPFSNPSGLILQATYITVFMCILHIYIYIYIIAKQKLVTHL